MSEIAYALKSVFEDANIEENDSLITFEGYGLSVKVRLHWGMIESVANKTNIAIRDQIQYLSTIYQILGRFSWINND